MLKTHGKFYMNLWMNEDLKLKMKNKSMKDIYWFILYFMTFFSSEAQKREKRKGNQVHENSFSKFIINQ